MNLRTEGARWSPVDRSKPVSRPERGARTPVSRRSAEEQAAYRARLEVQRATAEREAPLAEAESADDQWEVSRKSFETQGDVFNAQGFITEKGREKLILAGLDTTQITYLENLQRNHVGEVAVVSVGESRDEGPAMSARERPKKFADAQVAAEQLLQDRGQAEAEKRKQQGARAMAGMRARSNAIFAGKSDADADRLQRQAEEAYDLQQQQEQDARAAS